jgi:hypothetical protein
MGHAGALLGHCPITPSPVSRPNRTTYRERPSRTLADAWECLACPLSLPLLFRLLVAGLVNADENLAWLAVSIVCVACNINVHITSHPSVTSPNKKARARSPDLDALVFLRSILQTMLGLSFAKSMQALSCLVVSARTLCQERRNQTKMGATYSSLMDA